jgi:putative DNA methylase
MAELTPFLLKDAPALIESVFPAQKVSYEALRERSSGRSQTLTALGSYWKGRKPLILVRSIILGCLLPQTDDAEKDLEIYEKLMAFDEESLARRSFKQNKIKPKDIVSRVQLDRPWEYFSYGTNNTEKSLDELESITCPFDPSVYGVNIKWNSDVAEETRILLIRKYLETYSGYESRASWCRRPEELDQDWLFSHVWNDVNKHYHKFGIDAFSHDTLLEQLGILRYGRRPKVGDAFSGGGSIPFEAARFGCDAYASDLNPVACMLTWGAVNVVGASEESRNKIQSAQIKLTSKIDEEITSLGIEHDKQGNRAKAFLYCLETICPETGWKVPMSASWVISKSRSIVARMTPNYDERRFNIEVVEGVSREELKEAEAGTISNGNLIYDLDGVTHVTPVKTIRGDYRDEKGVNRNRLRVWEKEDFMPKYEDIFQERLYAIQWVTKDSIEDFRQETFFTGVGRDDLVREEIVENYVKDHLQEWQSKGLVPDMAIESGDKTDEPIRTRGWAYWHQLFSPRNLLVAALTNEFVIAESAFSLFDVLNFNAKLCRWATSGKRVAKDGSGKQTGGASDNATDVFSNQALNTNYNYGFRSYLGLKDSFLPSYHSRGVIRTDVQIETKAAKEVATCCDLWITDPPYADAVQYHEITEFFIGWLRKKPPAPFDEWTWDSRRALAVKGVGDDFRKGMVDAYSSMAKNMPDNGMQSVMFTHQDTGVWSDMVGIFWAAGLQVVGAWYIATETTSELKKGGYVQGTVILMLRKRPQGDKPGFKQRILPAVRNEVKNQIEQMLHLNTGVANKMGEPVFNDSDLQMAGYAAALKVLTAYTSIGGEDVTAFALKPRKKGETTVVDEIVQQASEAANSLLIPEGLQAKTWDALAGMQRFYLRMLDMETTGAGKLDNYQNFAKAFRVEDYTKVMASMQANKARLKTVKEFVSRDLSDNTEFGASHLGKLTIALQQLLKDIDPQDVVKQLQIDLPDFLEVRPLLIDMLNFMIQKVQDPEVRDMADTLSGRLRNLRALGE